MDHSEILQLAYYVKQGQAYNGRFKPGDLHRADYASHIDALLTNARNMYIAADTIVCILTDVVRDYDTENNIRQEAIAQLKVFIDILRINCAASRGDGSLPVLMFPAEYHAFVTTPLVTPVTDNLMNSTVALTSERLSRSDTVDNVVHVDFSSQRRKKN